MSEDEGFLMALVFGNLVVSYFFPDFSCAFLVDFMLNFDKLDGI